LAEASLDDVDKFLMSRGLKYLRYVDDFRVFCKNERDAVDAAHDLAEYLYTAHRLVLTPSKTKLYSIEKFVSEELRDPAEEEERGKVSKLKSRMKDIFDMTGYHVELEDLPESELNKATRANLVELFDEAIAVRPLHLGLTRYLLRRARQLRTNVLRKRVVDNLKALAPAMRDVVDYLTFPAKPTDAVDIGEAMLDHLTTSSVGNLAFVRLWGLELFIRRPVVDLLDRVLELSDASREVLGLRTRALLAKSYGQVQWVRAQKEKWANHAPWDRRAIIWAASVLPDDERHHWCKLVKRTASDPLDGAVATLAGNA
jgi:hypothetical protein